MEQSKNTHKQGFSLLNEAEAQIGPLSTHECSSENSQSLILKIREFLFHGVSRRLRNHLSRRHQLNLTHSQGLDAVSSALGCPAWRAAKGASADFTQEDYVLNLLNKEVAERGDVAELLKRMQFLHNTLVVGASGTGKSEGLWRALPGISEQRPVFILTALGSLYHRVAGADNGARNFVDLGLLNAMETHQFIERNALSASFIYDSCTLERVGSRPSGEESLLISNLLSILDNRVRQGVRPVLIIDEPHGIFGMDGLECLLQTISKMPDIAKAVTVVCALQSVSSLSLFSRKFFKEALLLKVYSFASDAELTSLGCSRELTDQRRSLSIGEALHVSVQLSSFSVGDGK